MARAADGRMFDPAERRARAAAHDMMVVGTTAWRARSRRTVYAQRSMKRLRPGAANYIRTSHSSGSAILKPPGDRVRSCARIAGSVTHRFHPGSRGIEKFTRGEGGPPSLSGPRGRGHTSIAVHWLFRRFGLCRTRPWVFGPRWNNCKVNVNFKHVRLKFIVGKRVCLKSSHERV